MWMQDGAEQQYYVTLKFNFYRGLGGAMWSIFRYYFLGLVCTFVFLAWLKRWGHDMTNYYSVKYVALEGKPGYHQGLMPAQMNAIRKAQNDNANCDVLGRSIICLI
jgi:hypothetical protein